MSEVITNIPTLLGCTIINFYWQLLSPPLQRLCNVSRKSEF